MYRRDGSHSVSPIFHSRRIRIPSSSVSKRTTARPPVPRLRRYHLIFHPLFQRLSDSSGLSSESQTPKSPAVNLPDDYITNLNSSIEQENRNTATEALDQGVETQPQPVENPPSYLPTMSSRRSDHSSSSKTSSRRHHTSQQSTTQLIETLNTRRINTMTELRRIERVAAEAHPSIQLAFQSPMTSAWNYYVTSNNFLGELRGLTRSYPFSSAMLDDAKWRVQNDPESNRSWNFAWLCLRKLIDDQMIQAWAAGEAAQPEMWGGRIPDQADAEQLAACFAYEWNEAVETMLRHWEVPPTTTGY